MIYVKIIIHLIQISWCYMLTGTFNNNTDDDFERPDGTTLDINSTIEQIHSGFGQKCKW